MWDLIIFCSWKYLNLVSIIKFQYSVAWLAIGESVSISFKGQTPISSSFKKSRAGDGVITRRVYPRILSTASPQRDQPWKVKNQEYAHHHCYHMVSCLLFSLRHLLHFLVSMERLTSLLTQHSTRQNQTLQPLALHLPLIPSTNCISLLKLPSENLIGHWPANE